jgi:hypothetical protein
MDIGERRMSYFMGGDRRLRWKDPPKGEGTPIVAHCCVEGCAARLEWYKNLGRGQWKFLLPGDKALSLREELKAAPFYCPDHYAEYNAARVQTNMKDAPEEPGGWLD